MSSFGSIISATAGKILLATGPETAGNSIASESSGTVTIAGALDVTGRVRARATAGGWKDLLGAYIPRTAGVTVPTLATVGGSVVQMPKWQLGDLAYSMFHVPHSYALGQSIYWHVHWITDGTDINTVKWQFSYYYAEGYALGTFAFGGGGTVITCEEAASGV